MKFTYKEYEEILSLIKTRGYEICDYSDYRSLEKCVILRHDVDFSLEKALVLAKLENSMNVKSTYFILLSTNFYNVFSKRSFDILSEIISLGHNIGLHFDEKRYQIKNAKDLEFWVYKELDLLGKSIDANINLVSMHRPSKWVLENDIQFSKAINSYSKVFISDFKYLSDSRMHWREDVLNTIDQMSYNRLHILTHAFWYSHNCESMKEKLINFITSSKLRTYVEVQQNFRNIEEVFAKEDIE